MSEETTSTGEDSTEPRFRLPTTSDYSSDQMERLGNIRDALVVVEETCKNNIRIEPGSKSARHWGYVLNNLGNAWDQAKEAVKLEAPIAGEGEGEKAVGNG